MFYKTISKNFFFVISIFFVCFTLTACSHVFSDSHKGRSKKKKDFSNDFEKPKVLGKIESKDIKESSGLVASRCNENVFWTHNDSGNGNFIYAIDNEGKEIGTWQVLGAKNTDWEDIATLKNSEGNCFLYIGDIGNNSRKRSELTVFKVREPEIAKRNRSNKKAPLSTKKAEAIKFAYPQLRRDAETLLIHPETEDLYILTKRFSGASGVYKLSGYKVGQTNSLKEVAKLGVPALPNGLLTGGEIAADGSRIILCDYYNGYEIVLPKDAKDFDEIWKDEPSIIDIGTREQGEAIGYSVDGEAIYATSEKKNSPFIEVRRKN